MKLIITIFFLIPYLLFAAEFAYIKGNKANLRIGPSIDYPIEWVYTEKGMPIEVLSQHEDWYRVRDIDGTLGWMQEHILNKKKHCIITETTVIRSRDSSKAKVQAYVDRYVIARVIKCKGEWCKINVVGKITGWIDKKYIWGVSD